MRSFKKALRRKIVDISRAFEMLNDYKVNWVILPPKAP